MRIFLIDSVVLTTFHSRMTEPLRARRFLTPLDLPFLDEEDWTEEEDEREEDWVTEEELEAGAKEDD